MKRKVGSVVQHNVNSQTESWSSGITVIAQSKLNASMLLESVKYTAGSARW